MVGYQITTLLSTSGRVAHSGQRDLAEYEADMNYSMHDRYLNSYYKNAAEGRTPMAEKINQRTMIPFEDVYAEWTDYWRDADYAIPFDEVPRILSDEYSRASTFLAKCLTKPNYTEAIQDRALVIMTLTSATSSVISTVGATARARLSCLQADTSVQCLPSIVTTSTVPPDWDSIRTVTTSVTRLPFGRDWQEVMEGLNYLNLF